MGLRFSCDSNKPSSATNRLKVTVITPEGFVQEFSTPVFASDTLLSAGETHFLCNSDTLYFDSEVSAVGPDKLLQPGQLYFMLPDYMLENTLSSADIAALAVKASSALAPLNPKRRTGKGVRRLLVGISSAPYEENEKLNQRLNEDTLRAGGARSPVARKPARRGSTSNRRPRVMRRRLSIIEEMG
jgi:PADRE domain